MRAHRSLVKSRGRTFVSAELPFKRGAIELLLLKTVSWRPMHGYAIAQWIQDTTDDALKVEEGSLYPALHRLENKGLIESRWGTSENNRQAKFYTLTPEGRRTLRAESESWVQYAAAITKVITATKQPV
jgi:PadR family transcriptional regulator, regulatory protein PadR